jgi:hypothetical protein
VGIVEQRVFEHGPSIILPMTSTKPLVVTVDHAAVPAPPRSIGLLNRG